MYLFFLFFFFVIATLIVSGPSSFTQKSFSCSRHQKIILSSFGIWRRLPRPRSKCVELRCNNGEVRCMRCPLYDLTHVMAKKTIIGKTVPLIRWSSRTRVVQAHQSARALDSALAESCIGFVSPVEISRQTSLSPDCESCVTPDSLNLSNDLQWLHSEKKFQFGWLIMFWKLRKLSTGWAVWWKDAVLLPAPLLLLSVIAETPFPR